MRFTRPLIPLLLLVLVPVALSGASKDELKFFETHIRPLLAENCFECHGEDKQKAGLRLDHIDFITAGGDTGPAVVRGDAEASLLIEAVRYTDPDFEMPPKKPLEAEQVALLERWVNAGAPWPEEPGMSPELARDENGFTAEDRAWWAIQPVRDPEVPVEGEGWARNEIDMFVARRLAEHDLEPAAEASPEELVRRAYFDLHGLPPTPEERRAFLDAAEKDLEGAWAALIEELLASPRYGERWAQHWLDVVRYAESDGYRQDAFRPEAWRYRDYVIRSINEDKPYDQFVREQLAADEFAREDPETLIATAFLRHGVYEWNQRDAEMHWDIIMTEMTNVTSEAFLGLGIGCAQCHDHKFDPILQEDHFALRSFLSTVWWPENEPYATPEQLARYEARMGQWEKVAGELQARMDELVKQTYDNRRNFVVGQFPEEIQAMYRTPAAERTAYEEQMAQLVQRQVDAQLGRHKPDKYLKLHPEKKAEYEALQKKLAAHAELKPKPLPTAFISTDIDREPAQTLLKTRRGETDVQPAFLTLLGQPAPRIEPREHTTGRRSALADWIADAENPLSTRVFVNRIWQRHFGRGIVATPNDFGNLGEPPSHPELLDWLTLRFVENGWRMKPVHRMIMLSSTYRQTSRREPSQHEVMADLENRYLWRFPPTRLSAEQIRDAMLSISGELSSKSDGPPLGGDSTARSVFVKKMRNSPDPVLAGFDAPSGFDSAPTRLETTTPTQSLLLINNEWPMARARAFARRVMGGAREVSKLEIAEAYRLAWGRTPSRAEMQAGLDFVKVQTADHRAATPAEPKYRFPNENGLRPSGQHFAAVEDHKLGSKALWLQPGSRFERLEVQQPDFDGDAFVVEAVAVLESLHKDASVNTLISRWNGNQKTSGWTFGVTSEKSRYQPRNFIVQLTGRNPGGEMEYEVVASNLRVPLGVPVYLAAAIETHPEGRGTVTFWMKDLSDPEAKLESVEVPHNLAEAIQDPGTKLTVGGRVDSTQHSWDGQLAKLTLREPGVLEGSPLIDWTFSGDGEEPAPGTAWIRAPKPKPAGASEPVLAAMTDFCHALLNSNEFLYLH